MIRTVKINSPINKGKLQEVHKFLVEYQNCVNYFIARLWSEKRFHGSYLEKEYINSAKGRFKLTARLIQCAGKQAFEVVKSQRKKETMQYPRFKKLQANIDSRFWTIEDKENTFNWLKLQSGFKVLIPFKKSTLWDKWINNGYTLSKSMRISKHKNKLELEFFFEKEAPQLKSEGDTEGIDLGYVNLATCSDGQMVGKHLNEYIKTFSKREKHTHETITNKVYHELKSLDLSNINRLVVENLNKVKNGKRGMFSRTHNKRLSHWLYAKVIRWLEQRCEEQGIRIEYKSPYKTSQCCPVCRKWDRRNRSGERFKCIYCGYENHADRVGALNLKSLGLAGVYSLRLLPTESHSLYLDM
jgi:IS605 OrfB family transposase